MYVLAMEDGEMQWKLETDGPIMGAPAIAGNRVVINSLDGSVAERASHKRSVKHPRPGNIVQSLPRRLPADHPASVLPDLHFL